MAAGVTTEWEDIHVKNGNYIARERDPTGEEVFQQNMEDMEGFDMNKKKREEEEKDKDSDSDFDLDDDEFMKEYRQK